MRVLFYVEPVVFRGDPFFLAPHLTGWILPVVKAHNSPGFTWALATSDSLCSLAKTQHPGLNTFPVSSWGVLSNCDFRRDVYSAALFNPEAALQAISGRGQLASLATELECINLAFQPDLVVATAQNSLLPLAFPQARCLWMEQAPLPRKKGVARVYFDPCGHQVDSALQASAQKIRNITLDSDTATALMDIWQAMLEPPDAELLKAQQLQDEIRCLAGGQRVALLVLQPPDWLSWDGSLGGALPPEAMLAQWAATLPGGWKGVPLYHPDALTKPALASSLASEFPNLIQLPNEMSGNMAEWALPAADAIVTVSSSMAGQALIAGKQVVTCSRSPMCAFAATSTEALAKPAPSLNPMERVALLAFLSNRYTMTLAEMHDPDGLFLNHLKALAQASDPVDWLLDLTDWSPKHLARLT